MKPFKKYLFLLTIPFAAISYGCDPGGIEPEETYYVLSWDQNWLVGKSSGEMVVKASYIVENATGNPEVEAGVVLTDGDGNPGQDFFPATTPYTPSQAGVVFETTIAGLTPATEYTFKTYVKAGGKTFYGDHTRTVTTDSDGRGDGYFISVSNPSTANLVYNSVRLSGSWSFTEGTATVDEVGFKYRKDGTTGWSTLTSSGTNNPCYYTWTAANGGLEAGTKYVVTFWVKIGDRVHESSTATFTTPQAPDLPPSTGQFAWAELPVIKKTDEVRYVTHYVSSSGESTAANTPGRRRSYTIAFDKSKRQALWVAYPMHTWYNGTVGRKEKWQYDPAIPSSEQSDLSEGAYTGPYSKGHLLRSDHRQKTVTMNHQTFYWSNMAPQTQNSFNGGIWLKLEDKEQDWGFLGASSTDTLFVVTGSVFLDNVTTKDNSGNTIPVPSNFYKAFLMKKSGTGNKSISECSASELKCAAFYFVHKEGYYANNARPSASHMKSVAEIEEITGYEFFPMLSESAKSVKNSYTASDWGM